MNEEEIKKKENAIKENNTTDNINNKSEKYLLPPRTTMKKTLTTIVASVLMLSTIALASCKKEPTTEEPTPPTTTEEPVYETLVGTEWEGTCLNHVVTQSHGTFDIIVHWTVDFRANGQSEVMWWLESPGIDPGIDTHESTYVYEGGNKGTLSFGSDRPFVIDPYNRTMTITLTFDAEFESDMTSTLGGETVLHQMR